MRIRLNKTELSNALSVVTRAIASRTTMPILEGVYMEAMDDHVKLIATDLQKGIETSLPAIVLEKGAVVLPGRLFSEVVRKLPEEEVEIALQGTTVALDCLYSHTTLSAQDAEQYPSLPAVESALPITVSQVKFKDLIRQTIFSVATEELRPALTGALLEINGENCRMVALDGFRLALRQTKLGDNYGSLNAVIPGSSLTEIAKVLSSNAEDKMRITLTATHFLADMGNTRFITRLLDSEYVKYNQILPSEWRSRAKVATSEFGAALERASTLAREGRNNLVRFNMTSSEIVLKADSEFGQANEKIGCKLEGEELEIAFNARYLNDILKNLDEDELYLCFNTNISPCVIRPIEGDDFLYLVLPVRIYA
jgi:DNA polymerase-3 subunit beta